jgi:hypothetical protein
MLGCSPIYRKTSFFHTMEEYADEKLLFTRFAEATDEPFVAVVNSDDPVGRRGSPSGIVGGKPGPSLLPPFSPMVFARSARVK